MTAYIMYTDQWLFLDDQSRTNYWGFFVYLCSSEYLSLPGFRFDNCAPDLNICIAMAEIWQSLCRSGRRQMIGKPIAKFPNLTTGCPKKVCFKLFLKFVVEQPMQWETSATRNAFGAGLSLSWRNPLLLRYPIGIGCSTTNLQKRLKQTFLGHALNGWSATLSVICSNCSIPHTPCPWPRPSN